jgi:fatty acid synthase subunit beta
MARVGDLDSNPHAVIAALLAAYPQAATTLVCDEDIAFFINLCADLRNGKPVNFIPEIDSHLDYWFKKDSLWMSEELDAVASANQESMAEAAQRVVTLQGPVAVSYSQKLDEPVCDVFAEICDGYVELCQQSAAATPDAVAKVAYFGGPTPMGHAASGSATFPTAAAGAAAAAAATADELVPLLPAVDKWMHTLSGPVKGWRSALLLSSKVVRGKLWVDNPLPALLAPRPGQTVEYSDAAIKVFDGADDGSGGGGGAAAAPPAIELTMDEASSAIVLTVRDLPPPTREEPHPVPAVLTSVYTYVPSMGYAPIHCETDEAAEAHVKDMYAHLWLNAADRAEPAFSIETVHSSEFTVTAADIDAFNAAIPDGGK